METNVMQQIVCKKEVGNLKHNNNKLLLSKLSSVALTTTFSIALLLSTNAMADGTVATGNKETMKVSQQDVNTVKATISSKPMNKEGKKKSLNKDNRIGAYSLKDGSMEGAYGDGIYDE